MEKQNPKILTIGKVNLDKLREDIVDIPNQRQFPLQGLNEDDKNSSISYDLKVRDNEEDYIVRLYDHMDYTYSVIDDFDLYRTRYMYLPSITTYGIHKDRTPRIHIPIETNHNCFFVLDDEVVRLPADGSVYWVDTTLTHTFVNANAHLAKFVRVHLIGNTKLSLHEARSLADRL